MKRILYSLLVATLPFGSVLADAPKSKNAKVTLVYQHELPNVPGKSIKGVLVEYGPGGYLPGHTHDWTGNSHPISAPARRVPSRSGGGKADAPRLRPRAKSLARRVRLSRTRFPRYR
jgi:hypothetical protein